MTIDTRAAAFGGLVAPDPERLACPKRRQTPPKHKTGFQRRRPGPGCCTCMRRPSRPAACSTEPASMHSHRGLKEGHPTVRRAPTCIAPRHWSKPSGQGPTHVTRGWRSAGTWLGWAVVSSTAAHLQPEPPEGPNKGPQPTNTSRQTPCLALPTTTRGGLFLLSMQRGTPHGTCTASGASPLAPASLRLRNHPGLATGIQDPAVRFRSYQPVAAHKVQSTCRAHT